MRIRTFYMPDEIVTNLYTNGGEFQTEDGTEYKGLYHRYLTNEVYTEANWNPRTSKKLLPFIPALNKNTPYAKLKKKLKTRYFTPIPVLINITPSDQKAGVIKRYFLKKINELVFIEIDKIQYSAWQANQIDPYTYAAVEINWYITGNIEDEKNGLVIIKGVQTKNTEQIAYAEKRLPGISSILTDPLQYYSDNTFQIPVDINQR